MASENGSVTGEKHEYDVVIVGGGPAGSTTGYEIAQRSDKSVCILEAKETPAAQCAGGIGVPLLRQSGLDGEVPDDVIATEINEVELRTENESTTISVEDIPSDIEYLGLTVNRDEFDQWLLFDRAESAGVDVFTECQVSDFDVYGDHEEFTVHATHDGEEMLIDAEYVVGAAGVSYTIPEKLGFEDWEPDEGDLHVGTQYHIVDEEWPQEKILLYVSEKYAPRGYLWAFPEGNSFYEDGPVVRWGTGVDVSEGDAVARIEQFLEDTGRSDNEVVNRTAGLVPTTPAQESCQIGNALLVGDNAHQVDPLHGGGIANGAIAGKAAGRAIATDQPEKYDGWWKDEIGETLSRRYTFKQMLYNTFFGDPEKWDRWVKIIDNYDPETINPNREIPRLVKHTIKEDPTLIPQFVYDGVMNNISLQWNTLKGKIDGITSSRND